MFVFRQFSVRFTLILCIYNLSGIFKEYVAPDDYTLLQISTGRKFQSHASAKNIDPYQPEQSAYRSLVTVFQFCSSKDNST